MSNSQRARRGQAAPELQPERQGWAPVVLGVGTFCLYAACLNQGLTNWDDPDYVTNNPVAAQGWSGVVSAFTTVLDGAWYPLTHAAYAVVRAVGGGVGALHFLQVLLFAFTVALVPLALRPFGVWPSLGIAIAALWASHPFRVESVAWAANLKDTLGVALVVAAFACFGRARPRLALGLFVAALLSKSAFFGLSVLFPVLLLVQGVPLVPTVKRTWPMLVAGVLVAAVAGFLHLSGTVPSTAPEVRLSTALWTPWWYLGRTLWPSSPRAIYDFQWVLPFTPRFFVALGLWILFGVAVWKARPNVRRVVLLVSAAYVLALLPVGGLAPLRYPVADRYTLLPSLALFAGLGVALWTQVPHRIALVCTWAAAAVLIPFSVSRQLEWKDSISLWESNLRVTPHHWTVHINLSNAYAEVGRIEDAQREVEAALRVNPERLDALTQALTFAAERDRIPPADFHPLRSRLQQERFAEAALIRSSEWCLSLNYFRTAKVLLERAAEGSNHRPRAARMLSVVARREKRFGEAVVAARKAIELGDGLARVELVYALADLGQFAEALEVASFQFSEPHPIAQLQGARGYALVRMGRVEEGTAEAGAALRAMQELSSAAP